MEDESNEQLDHPPAPRGVVALPRRRWWAALSGTMLAVGIAVGAAIGPAPATTLAGNVPGLAQQLPLLIARLAAAHSAATPAPSPATTQSPAPATPATATPAAPTPAQAAKPAAAKEAAPSKSEETAPPSSSQEKGAAKTTKLPAITNVWLIELSGPGFEAATGAEKAAAPYVNGTLLAQSTLLAGWSAPQATAFAAEATLAQPPAAGAPPPLLHSIVQPPCPEAQLATCGPEKPGQLSAADEFLKATLATITSTPAYREHGLVVVTFATVGIATQSELPAGTSTATLSYRPPAGVALLSPFAKVGRSSVSFNTTSPRRSLEALLH